jgi:hypothetical protein
VKRTRRGVAGSELEGRTSLPIPEPPATEAMNQAEEKTTGAVPTIRRDLRKQYLQGALQGQRYSDSSGSSYWGLPNEIQRLREQSWNGTNQVGTALEGDVGIGRRGESKTMPQGL